MRRAAPPRPGLRESSPRVTRNAVGVRFPSSDRNATELSIAMRKIPNVTVVAGLAAQVRLAKALNLVLADTYALMSLTHHAHWNVEGPGFFSLHEAFQVQYEALFQAVDEIAERVRALDQYAVGGLGTLARMSGMEEFGAPESQRHYVSGLLKAHEKVLADAAVCRDLAGELGDAQTQDLMIRRVQEHEKIAWMLRSFLKSAER